MASSTSCLMSSLVVVMMIIMTIVGLVQSGPPRNIVRRQASDSSNLHDNQLIGCFTSLATGNQCNTIPSGNINDIPVPTTTARPGCQCVPHTQCSDTNTPTAITPDGDFLSLIDPRSSCTDPFDTCCINIGPPEPVTPPPNYTPECGHLNPGGVKSTFVGLQDKEAQFGQFPWMAAVMGSDNAGGPNAYLSGGSLLDKKVIMTAAHKIIDKEAHQLVVRLGEWNFKLATEPISHQDIRVKRIARHPAFLHNRLYYDIALLILENDAILGRTVDTICLPNPSETFDGAASCFSSGWGKDVFGQSGKYQQILKSLTLPVVSHPQCQNAYRGTALGNTFDLHKSFMCAGGQRGLDTCTGDGGSPLVCPQKGDPSRYVQVGVVSWGIGCGEEGIPGVYASVSEAANWINQEILRASGINERRPFS